MKSGPCNTYLTERIASLLDAHGPDADEDSSRGLAEKLKYIVPAWDAVLRDEKRRWRELLKDEDWFVLLSCTLSHAFAMEVGGPPETDLGAILACVEDTLDSELAMDDPAKWRKSALSKLAGVTHAQDLALVWMLVRERKRLGQSKN